MMSSLLSHGVGADRRRSGGLVFEFLRREVSRCKRVSIEKRRRVVLAQTDKRPFVKGEEFFEKYVRCDFKLMDSPHVLDSKSFFKAYESYCRESNRQAVNESLLSKQLRNWLRGSLLTGGVVLSVADNYLRRMKVRGGYNAEFKRPYLLRGIQLTNSLPYATA